MMFRNFTVLLLLTWTASAFAEEENTQPAKPRPGIFQRITHVFHRGKDKDPASGNQEKRKQESLDLKMTVSPETLKLSESHQIQVTLVLTNNTRKIEQLDFPTTQRIEVLLRTDSGKLVTQWSEDQSFSNDPGYVTINPHEHVEYTATISGRDLIAGKSYTLEGFFPNFDKLRVSKLITPVR